MASSSMNPRSSSTKSATASACSSRSGASSLLILILRWIRLRVPFELVARADAPLPTTSGVRAVALRVRGGLRPLLGLARAALLGPSRRSALRASARFGPLLRLPPLLQVAPARLRALSHVGHPRHDPPLGLGVVGLGLLGLDLPLECLRADVALPDQVRLLRDLERVGHRPIDHEPRRELQPEE